MRREPRAGHVQAARMGEAGLELEAAHALGMGHAQGAADQEPQRADRAAQHQVSAFAAKQRVTGEADAQAQVAGTMARVGMRLALAGEAQLVVVHHARRDAHLEVPGVQLPATAATAAAGAGVAVAAPLAVGAALQAGGPAHTARAAAGRA